MSAGRFFPARVVTARWARRCMWCPHVILKGEQYERHSWVDGCGSAGTHVSCMTCVGGR